MFYMLCTIHQSAINIAGAGSNEALIDPINYNKPHITYMFKGISLLWVNILNNE